MPTFVALDVETANPNLASICQIGVAAFRDGEVVDRWSTLIDPLDYFSPANVSVHGIDEKTVLGAPVFADVVEDIAKKVAGSILVTHTAFDRTSLTRAHASCGAKLFDCTWLDSSRVARRAWPEVAQRGYGLRNLASMLDIPLTHHDALEDAIAAGLVVVRAVRESGQPINLWLDRVERRLDGRSQSASSRMEIEGNPDGPLFGEVACFTGQLSAPREDFATMAAAAGCKVEPGVTKRTTLLVVGDQDITKLAGKVKSNKHLKAELMISKGHPIRILGESDFLTLAGLA